MVKQTATPACTQPGGRILIVRIALLPFSSFFRVRWLRAIRRPSPPSAPVQLNLPSAAPRGLPRIAERIGERQPPGLGAVPRAHRRHFSRVPARTPTPSDHHRILWLRGPNPSSTAGGEGLHLRAYVYIHGTNHGRALAQPLSSGCVLSTTGNRGDST